MLEVGAYAEVNGIRMYCEIYGPQAGVPLVLLHGGGSTIAVTFGRILPFLARDRRVIAVEEKEGAQPQLNPDPAKLKTRAGADCGTHRGVSRHAVMSA